MTKILSTLLFCLACCCWLTPPIVAFEAKAVTNEAIFLRLTSAIERLDQQGSYRWTSEVEVPKDTGFLSVSTQGTTVRNGKTYALMSFGVSSTQVVIDGEKAAVTNRDGLWETVWSSDQGYSAVGSSASIAREVRIPVEDARALASSLTSLTEQGDVLVGDLSVDVAKDRLAIPGRFNAVGDVTGTVRFSISEGSLLRFVVRVEGKLVNDPPSREVWRQTTVELSDMGTATLEIPSGATQALKHSLPKPNPRLSQAEATKLLSLLGKRDVGVHDPSSIVKCDGEYWFFSTGTGISSWRSNDLQNWQRGPRVFPDIPDWITKVAPDQRGHFWAPDVIRRDGRYWLYYSISSFGKNSSAIALASTATLNPNDPAFGWKDEGIVIQSTTDDDFNAIDPAVILTKAGELWMSFGSFWSGLKIIKLDTKSGKRMANDETLRSIASDHQIEAPHIYQHDGWFYLFVNWGKCCSGIESTYNIRVGRSREITGPYLDQHGVDLAKGGGTLLLGSNGPFIGPGHANVFQENDRFLLSCHYYDATEDGRSMLSIQGLSWSIEGWPLVASEQNSGQTFIHTDQAPTQWIDPKTGHRVVRLSKQGGSACLYFHQNAYTPEGDKLLISTPRGLETVDLQSRELKVVVPKQSYQMGGSSGVEMGRKSRQVYFSTRTLEGTVVRATHIDTGETREIITLPRGASFNSVNADETQLFGSIQEFPQRDTQRDGNRSMKLFTVDIATGQIKMFHSSNAWLNHLQCSPVDPSLGLFCHEGSWHELDRVWTIRFGSDIAKLMHQRQQKYEIAGHEFFSADGQWVWYDLQTPRADQFWLAGVHVETGERIGYRLSRDQWSVHYNISRDGKLFAGDGGGPKSVANQTPLPEKRRLDSPGNGQWIYLFRPESDLTDGSLSGEPAKLGTCVGEKLVDLSAHDYDLEPNVTFTPDGKWVVFRSNMHGERHVYMVSTEREAEPTDVVQSRSTSEPETKNSRRRLILIGDSTVKNGSGRGDDELFGWGQMLDRYFDADQIEVENRALGGRSSRTYLTEGLWQKSLDRLRAGDFVMMQFGHNDGGNMFKDDRPRASIKGNGDESITGVVEATGTSETVQSFGWYLRKYITDAKAKGAIPIVLSQVPRNRWLNGHVIRSDKDYSLWARQAAEQSGALWIDLNEIVARRYEELGQAKVGRDLYTPNDWTHTKREGAQINAQCVIDGIKLLDDCALKDYLRKDPEVKDQSSWRFDFTGERETEGFQWVHPDDKFSTNRGYGYLEFQSDAPKQATGFAIQADEGNYTATIRFGSTAGPTSTTVKAEARRLMVEKVETATGQFVTRQFSVNVRQPEITPNRTTQLNHRELGPPIHPDWDDRLTFEFGGDRPGVASLEIRPASDIVTIFIAGDSTVTDQQSEPYASWGQMLPRFLNANIAISNHAESGLALHSFESQQRLEKLLSMMKPGDYVFIQFGHNDQKDSRPGAGAFTTYKLKLTEFIDAVRGNHGIPVLVTSVERLRMDDQGNQMPTLADYAQAVRQVGTEKDVPLIDLNAMSLKFYAALGPQRAAAAFAPNDQTHHNCYGAYELARCVVEGIRSQVPELAKHIADHANTFDPSMPDDPERFDLPQSPLQSAQKPAGD